MIICSSSPDSIKFMQPLVTIVTPSYNQGQFIEETIQSVLNQTYKNIQYIIVDGGSSDNTMPIVNNYADKIDIIIHEKDGGQADAINKGFRLAKGELAGWLNSDDILYPDCVKKIVELYQSNPEGSIYYSASLDWIDVNSSVIESRIINIPDKNHIVNNDYKIIQPGSFYKTSLLKKINYVNTSYHYCMDLDLWLRLLNHGAIYSLKNKSYSGFRIWEDSKTATGKAKFLKEILKVLNENGLMFFSKNNIMIYRNHLGILFRKVIKKRSLH